MNTFLKGLQLFASDLRKSVPLSVTFVIALVAFVLALAVATGFHL